MQKKTIFRDADAETVKIADFETPDSQKLIPRKKYEFAEKLPNFNTALCSRNFQNVKLRLDFVEIS